MFREMIAASLALLLGATSTHAFNELKGITKVRLVVGDLDDDAKKCGLTEEAIKRRLIPSVQFDTDIKIVDEPKIPQLKFEVLVLRKHGLCAAHVILQLVMIEPFDFAPDDKRAGTIELFRAGAIEATKKTDGAEILVAVGTLGHALAQQWDEDNL